MYVTKQVMKIKCHPSSHLNKQSKSSWFLLSIMSYKINIHRGIYNKRDICNALAYQEVNVTI